MLSQIDVILHKDKVLKQNDNGRGMPGGYSLNRKNFRCRAFCPNSTQGCRIRITLSLWWSTRGGNFSGERPSQRVEIAIKRNGEVYTIAFENGVKVEDLKVVGSCPKRQTGTSVRFYPNPKYFDSPNFSVSRLRHLLKGKRCFALNWPSILKITSIKPKRLVLRKMGFQTI